jgi:hypothetical protein
MTALKNDKVDMKPALEYVHPSIFEAIKDCKVDSNNLDNIKLILTLINKGKLDFNINTLNEILKAMAREIGTVPLMKAIGYAMRAGEIKYESWNFLKGHNYLQLMAAMERHGLQVMEGELFDVDTSERIDLSVSHYGCIGAGINMMMYQIEAGTLTLDLPITKEKVYAVQDSTKSSGTR